SGLSGKSSQIQLLHDLRVGDFPREPFVNASAFLQQLVVISRPGEDMQRLAEIGFRIALGNGKPVRASVDIEERRVVYIGFLELDGSSSRRSAAGWTLAIGNRCAEGFRNSGHVGYGVEQNLCF